MRYNYDTQERPISIKLETTLFGVTLENVAYYKPGSKQWIEYWHIDCNPHPSLIWSLFDQKPQVKTGEVRAIVYKTSVMPIGDGTCHDTKNLMANPPDCFGYPSIIYTHYFTPPPPLKNIDLSCFLSVDLKDIK